MGWRTWLERAEPKRPILFPICMLLGHTRIDDTMLAGKAPEAVRGPYGRDYLRGEWCAVCGLQYVVRVRPEPRRRQRRRARSESAMMALRSTSERPLKDAPLVPLDCSRFLWQRLPIAVARYNCPPPPLREEGLGEVGYTMASTIGSDHSVGARPHSTAGPSRCGRLSARRSWYSPTQAMCSRLVAPRVPNGTPAVITTRWPLSAKPRQ